MTPYVEQRRSAAAARFRHQSASKSNADSDGRTDRAPRSFSEGERNGRHKKQLPLLRVSSDQSIVRRFDRTDRAIAHRDSEPEMQRSSLFRSPNEGEQGAGSFRDTEMTGKQMDKLRGLIYTIWIGHYRRSNHTNILDGYPS